MRGKHQTWWFTVHNLCVQKSSICLKNRRRAVEREREREEFAHIHTTDPVNQDDSQSHMMRSYGHKVLSTLWWSGLLLFFSGYHSSKLGLKDFGVSSLLSPERQQWCTAKPNRVCCLISIATISSIIFTFFFKKKKKILDTSTLLYKVCTNVVQQTLLFQNTVTRQNSHKRIFLPKFIQGHVIK
jgi:hypothetical protein